MPTEILTQRRVYPRVGGGTALLLHYGCNGIGLSPRGRGNQSNGPSQYLGIRSIPAWAGEPITSRTLMIVDDVYPRVGGGTMFAHSERH